jgi:hypothetical protein
VVQAKDGVYGMISSIRGASMNGTMFATANGEDIYIKFLFYVL